VTNHFHIRFLLTLCLALGLLTACRERRETACPMDLDPMFAYGVVETIGAQTFQMREYNYEADKSIVMTYQVTADTEFGNIKGLFDLKPGDPVVLDYEMRGKVRVATALIKEEETDETAHLPSDSNTGLLQVAPDFQQIGENLTCEEAPSLSGIWEWLTEDQLPNPSEASVVRTFGPHRLLMWESGSDETTVAFWRSNVLQFAFNGVAFSITSPPSLNNPDFEDPPPGTDLDKDGVPDLLLYDKSEGDYGLFSVKHIVCSDPPVLTAQIYGWHTEPVCQDLDEDGRYEIVVSDPAFADWNAFYFESPRPLVIYRMHQGRYELAGDLMRHHALPQEEVQAGIDDLHHRLSRLDYWQSRLADPNNFRGNQTADEQADDDFFVTMGWDKMTVQIPPMVWGFLLDLIYRGQVDQAVEALQTVWPAGRPGRNLFASELLGMIQGSAYGSQLPWMPELETKFGTAFHVQQVVKAMPDNPYGPNYWFRATSRGGEPLCPY
jgi:hypothetical protein